MKELSFEKMEVVTGGAVPCFFSVPNFVLSVSVIGWATGWMGSAYDRMSYCWNS